MGRKGILLITLVRAAVSAALTAQSRQFSSQFSRSPPFLLPAALLAFLFAELTTSKVLLKSVTTLMSD